MKRGLSRLPIRSRSRSRSRSRGRPRRRLSYSQMTPQSKGRRMSLPTPSSRRSSGQFTKLAGALSGAALGALVNDVPGAIMGAEMGYRAGSREPTRRRVNAYTGTKVGRFSRKRVKLSKETMALKKGYHCTSEIHANVTDPHCVYVAHSASHYGLMTRTLMGAMFRKLFLKAGISIPDRNQELPLFDQFNSDGFKIVYQYQNPVTGSAVTLNIVTVDNQSLTNLVDSFPLMATNLYSIFTANNGVEPNSLALYSSDRNLADTNWRLASQINLRTEIINWHITSELKVQNRTAGAAAAIGDIGDADRVDQQPLQGYLYNFKGGEPRLKHTTNWDVSVLNDDEKLSRIREYGENHIPSSLLPQPYQEPPVPKLWANCVGASKVILQPGDIKNTKISFTFRGKLPNMLKKLKTTFTESGFVKGVPGKCQILALEEYMRTPDNNNILIGLERELKIGCWLDTGKTSDIFTSDYSEATPADG